MGFGIALAEEDRELIKGLADTFTKLGSGLNKNLARLNKNLEEFNDNHKKG